MRIPMTLRDLLRLAQGAGRDDSEEDRSGGLAAGLAGPGMAQALGGFDPGGGREKDLSFGDLGRHQDAIEADIVDNDAVG